MADVVVVGGGFGGIAAAARIAKLGHRVTICERAAGLGGALRPVERDGFRWDRGAATLVLPAPVRDLFRKSGRPLERVLDLLPVESARRHVLDGAGVDLPTLGRVAQARAVEAGLGPPAAEAWTAMVDGFEPVWDVLRTRTLEVPFHGIRSLGRRDLATLRPWSSMSSAARRLPDPLARAMVTYPAVAQGSDPRRTPAFVGVLTYVERTFGRWAFPGGMASLLDALSRRLEERRVTVRTCATVTGIGTHQGAVTGVRLARGEHLTADVVIAAVDAATVYGELLDDPPRTRVRRARPAAAPSMTHLGVREPPADLPYETVFHGSARGEPTVVLRAPTDPTLAPVGHAAWTILVHGRSTTDPLQLLAQHGVDLRSRVVTRVECRPGGCGFAWRGARTALHRASNRSPVDGLYCVGATAHPGAGLPFVALGAASVAEQLGKA